MWISKKRWESLEKRIADLEVQFQGQQLIQELVIHIMDSLKPDQDLDLISYQQLNSPSTERQDKVRVLIQKILELS
jgi:uncharacterized coiled-coil protein SlyX